MSKKQTVMSHDPLAGLSDGPAEQVDSATTDDSSASPELVTLELEDSLTIAEVSALQERLLLHVQAMDPLQIDACEVESVDAAGLQLIASAFKTAREKGLALSLTAVSETFLAAARQIGLDALFDLDQTADTTG